MRRMHTKKEIEEAAGGGFDPSEIPEGEITQGGIIGVNEDGEAVKGSLFGKYVRIMKASEINPNNLTDEQIEAIENGVFIDGDLLGLRDPVIYPPTVEGTRGIVMGTEAGGATYRFFYVTDYYLNKTNKTLAFSLGNHGALKLSLRAGGGYFLGSYYDQFRIYVSQINSKDFPAYPSDEGGKRYNFALNSGSLAWIQGNGLYLHTIEFAVSGSSDPLILTMVSDSTTPVLLDTTSGNFLCPNAEFIQFVNCDSFLFIRYGANGFNPDIRELDPSTGAFSSTITLTGVNTDTISALG